MATLSHKVGQCSIILWSMPLLNRKFYSEDCYIHFAKIVLVVPSFVLSTKQEFDGCQPSKESGEKVSNMMSMAKKHRKNNLKHIV